MVWGTRDETGWEQMSKSFFCRAADIIVPCGLPSRNVSISSPYGHETEKGLWDSHKC